MTGRRRALGALAWAALLGPALLPGSTASAAASAPMTLQLTSGGALVTGTVKASRADELTGMWSSVGRARLLRCAPRCSVVTVLPVTGALALGKDTGYRVVLGGTFKVGQKVSLVLRFRNSPILNLMVVVTR